MQSALPAAPCSFGTKTPAGGSSICTPPTSLRNPEANDGATDLSESVLLKPNERCRLTKDRCSLMRAAPALLDTERRFAREPVRGYLVELRRVMLRKLVAID